MNPTRLVPALVIVLCIGCATPTSRSSLGEREVVRIRELAPLPLPVFLARYYANSVGPAEAVVISASVGFFNNAALFRPKAELTEYCGLNGGALYRQSGTQRTWIDFSPETFSDPRQSGTAAMSLRFLCDASALNPACGAAKASREGVFGNFQCRERAGDRLLWTASVEASSGTIVSQTSKMARMEVTVAPVGR